MFVIKRKVFVGEHKVVYNDTCSLGGKVVEDGVGWLGEYFPECEGDGFDFEFSKKKNMEVGCANMMLNLL